MKLSDAAKNNPMLIGGALLIGVALVWIATRGAKEAGKDLGGAAANLIVGTAEGFIGGVNDGLGIPRTSEVIQAAKDGWAWVSDKAGSFFGATTTHGEAAKVAATATK